MCERDLHLLKLDQSYQPMFLPPQLIILLLNRVMDTLIIDLKRLDVNGRFCTILVVTTLAVIVMTRTIDGCELHFSTIQYS